MAGQKNIHTALAAAQAVMGRAEKGAENPAFKRDGKALRYADLASVMDACMPALSAHGISVMQPTGHDGDGHYCRTVLTHGDSDTSIDCRVPLFGVTAPQPYGSAVTYARRYGLMCMAGIAPDDEDDGNAAQGAAGKDPAPRKPDTSQAVSIASASLANAESLDQLAAIWKDLPRAIQGEASVIAAKDKRKAELTPAKEDLSDVPY